MAEKYELNININEGGEESSSSSDRYQTKGEGPRTVARPRHTTRSNGLDIWASLKSQLGDKTYDKTYSRIKQQASSQGKSEGEASKMADKAADKSKIKTMYLLNQAQQAINLTVDTITQAVMMHVGNEADANMISNLTATGNQVVGIGTNLIQGGIAAGGLGVGIAAAMEAYKLACKAYLLAEQTKKDNIGKAAEAERKANRLGYIQTGYSR